MQIAYNTISDLFVVIIGQRYEMILCYTNLTLELT